ncbi:MAG: hypothetical protein K9L74_00215 [Candidatus Izimaplasma sp.]|nr:hypothetical protein [Candidatus Izimaplasma bacterium]
MMKRLGLLTLLFLMGLALSGCDLIPSDIVDRATEELCREDPSHELCTVDDVDDIKETVAEELVLEAVSVLNDETNDRCDVVFSITNTDLLDSCKEGTLLPDDVESFTILEFEQDDDTYIFRGSTTEETFLEIKITIGSVDGAMRITSFTTSLIDDPMTDTLSLETFESLIKDYFNDYLDDTISDSVLAEMYYDFELKDSFINTRKTYLSNEVMINFISATMMDETLFEVTFEIVENETTRVSQDIRIEVQNNKPTTSLKVLDEDCDDDTVIACPGDDDELVTGDDANTFIYNYFLDYLDPDISDQQFADMYLGGQLEDDWSETRQYDLENDITITIKDIFFNDNNEFLVEYEYQDGDDLLLRKRPGRIRKRPDMLQAEWDSLIDESYVVDENYGKELIQQFIKDYQNLDISNEDLLKTYGHGDLDGDGLDDLVLTRQEDLKNGLTIEVDTSTPYLTFGLFTVNITLTQGDTQVRKQLSFMFKEIDKASPSIYMVSDPENLDCDDDDDGIFTCEIDDTLDLEAVENYLNQYIDDFLDPTLTDQQLADKYFNGNLRHNWLESIPRQHIIETETSLLIDTIYLNDDNEFAAEIIDDDTKDILVVVPGRGYHNHLSIKKGYDHYQAKQSSLIIDEDYAKEFIIQFLEDFQNRDISDEALLTMYTNGDVDGDGLDDLVDTRQEDLENGLTIDVDTDTPYLTFGLFTVNITLKQEDTQETKQLSFVLKDLDKASPYIAKIITGSGDCDDHDPSAWVCVGDDTLNEEDVNTFVETYYSDYLDPDLSDQAFADKYDGTEFEDDWSETRQYDLENDITITIKDIFFNDNNEFLVEYEYQDGDDLLLRKRPGRAKYGDITLKKSYVLDDPIDSSLILDQAYAKEFIQQFFNDYQNLEISTEAFLEQYFSDQTRDVPTVITQQGRLNDSEINLGFNTPYVTFGQFTVDVTIIVDNKQTTKQLSFMIKEIDKASPELYFINPSGEDDCKLINDRCEVISDSDMVLSHMRNFIDSYNNPTVTNDELNNHILGYLSILNTRNEDLDANLIWTLSETIRPLEDDFFLIQLQAETSDGVLVHRDLAARVYFDGTHVYIRENRLLDSCIFNITACE